MLEDDGEFTYQVVRKWLVERGEAEDNGWWLPPEAHTIWPAEIKKRRKS